MYVFYKQNPHILYKKKPSTLVTDKEYNKNNSL